MEKVKEFLEINGRVIVVVVLVLLGIFAISAATSNDDNAEENQTSEEVPGIPLSDSNTDRTPATPADGVEIGSKPQAGPVVIEKTEKTYTADARQGDNQTVIVRQIVNEYLADTDQSLNAAQRLFMETNLVNLLPRDDVIAVGEEISLTEDDIAPIAEEASSLTEAAQNRWSAYL